MAVDNIINVSEPDFEYEVIKYSQNVPVVVDFWASWCRPVRCSPRCSNAWHRKLTVRSAWPG